MIDDVWPLCRVENQRLPKDRPTLVFSPDIECLGALRDTFDANAFIMMTDQPESDLWNRIPLSLAILGCGSPGASTVSLSLPVNDVEWTTLADVILGVQSGRIYSTEPQDRSIHRCALGPGTSSRIPHWLHETIVAATNQLPGGTAERTAVAAGLHLMYDDLDGSHALSQTVEGRGKHHNCDYWHAIMHRREPDYGNAKYWFRRVGSHPIFAELPAVLEHIQSIMPSEALRRWSTRLVQSGRWDSFAMVDACEAAVEAGAYPQFRRALEELQHFEMLHLLVQSCRDAGHLPPMSSK